MPRARTKATYQPAAPIGRRLRCAIYLRVSTDDQAESGLGLEVQRAQCQAMVMVKSWDIVGVYEDAGISGIKGADKRPDLARLLKDIREGKIDCVIFAALDRLGRNTRIILDLVEKMSDSGVEIVSCRESLDTSTPTGKFVLTMFAALAQLDRDNIVKRTTDGREARGRRDGERGGNLPLGYTRGEKGVIVEPTGAALVRRIFSLAGGGFSLIAIAAKLNSEGVPTNHGGKSWYASSVREVLLREKIYRGAKRGDSTVAWPIILDSSFVLARKPGRRSGRRAA